MVFLVVCVCMRGCVYVGVWVVGAKCQVCKIGFLLPFLGYLRHFWVKVDKLYLFWEKIEIKAL